MRIDLHVHLQPYSRSSDFPLEAYAAAIERERLPVATVTDYGTVAGAVELEKRLGGVLVVYGVELTTHEGQFLVYSSDRKFLSELPPRLRTLEHLPRHKHTAVIWAHPRVPWQNGWRAPFRSKPLTRFLFRRVDGIEFFNGAMMDMGKRGGVEPHYHDNLRRLVEKWGVASVGGSACQTEAGFLSAWTVFPSLRNSQDFIEAIKDRAVKPGAVLEKPMLAAV